MEQRILAFAGKKQSGKNTAADFVTGYELRQRGVIKKFQVDEEGLWVNSVVVNGDGKSVEAMGLMDMSRTDHEFLNFVNNNIYPFVRSYSFATALKWIAIQVFGLDYESVYGTDEQKNAETHIPWINFLPFLDDKTIEDSIANPEKYTHNITGREFLQTFGTNVCRVIFDDCWTNNTINNIKRDNVPLALITDARFPNEIKAIKDAGGRVIKLTRKVSSDSHGSETAIDELDSNYYDEVIDNQDMDMQTKNDAIYNILLKWGWIESCL